MLSLPIIVGQLTTIVMGLIDIAMVGVLKPAEYGAMAVAAAGVSTAMFFLCTVLGVGIMMGVSTLVSIAKAKNDLATCGEYLKYSLVAALLTTLLLTAMLIIPIAYFDVFVKGEQIQQMGREFLIILTLGTFPLLAGLGVKNFADGLSFTKPAMIISVIGVGINAFLNWLFIYGNWGFPSLGLNGAGYATGISRVFIFVALLVYVFRSQLFIPYRKFTKGISLSSIHLKNIFKIGFPSGLQYFFEVGAFAVANVLTTWIGTFQSAAHQVALNLAAFTYMISVGLSIGGSIRVGSAFSEKNYHKAKLAGYAALILVLFTMVISAILFIALHKVLPPVFNKHPEVIYYSGILMLIAALFQLSDGLQAVSLGILRGLTDVRYPTIVTLVAYWGIGLPLAWVFAFPLQLGVEGVWYGLTLGLTISAILLSRRFWVLTTRRGR